MNSVSAWLDDQPAHDRNAERLRKAGAEAQRQRQRAEDRGERRHHDGTEAHQAGLIDRFARRQPLLAFRVEREVDHHDGVLFDDADEQQHADQGEQA